MLDEDVAQLSAQHDELAETLGAFGRPVDLRVLREDAEREPLRVAAGGVDQRDGLVDEHLRLVADLLAVRLALERIAQLEEPVGDALELLATLFVVQRVVERLRREPSRFVDELLRSAERHAFLDLDPQLIEVHDRERGRDERLLAELDRLREVDFLLRGEERYLPDLLEVHADGVVDADEIAREDRSDRILALHLLGLFLFVLDLRPGGRALGLEDLDVVVVKRGEELFDLTRLRVGNGADDVFLRDVALLAAAREPRPGVLKTTPQIPFPKAQRRDLDRLTRLDLVSELRRRCAECRYDGGQVSR